ncbi:LOW QUALITY PROTEIN: cilium assembly protein DZIP1L [Rhynochetos jubatus]
MTAFGKDAEEVGKLVEQVMSRVWVSRQLSASCRVEVVPVTAFSSVLCWVVLAAASAMGLHLMASSPSSQNLSCSEGIPTFPWWVEGLIYATKPHLQGPCTINQQVYLTCSYESGKITAFPALAFGCCALHVTLKGIREGKKRSNTRVKGGVSSCDFQIPCVNTEQGSHPTLTFICKMEMTVLSLTFGCPDVCRHQEKVGKPCSQGWLSLAAPCLCSALPMPSPPSVPDGTEPWRKASGSLASHLQTAFWGQKLEKTLILSLFLLQTGSGNHCPAVSELAEESLGKLSSCTMHTVVQRLPGFPDPCLVSTEVAQARQEAQACARRRAGWESRYCCAQHTQQHASTTRLHTRGRLACAGAPSAPKNTPFSADTYHPLHQPVPGMPGASLRLLIPADIPPFHFQPRRVSVDWRRFSAVDVERVAREVDVATLQDHITSVTFCNLDGERCPHCGQPADPVLLKVLRLAQLSIEYLLHCQEHLGTSLAMHAQRLQVAHAELACTQQQAAEQEAQLRGAKEENRMWKKLIATQQLLLQAGPNTYCKCHLCDKTFMNDSFLRAHVQRRHREATEAERQKIKQVEQMEDELEELKAKLRETRQQLEVEREAEKLRREQEMERVRQREEEGRRDLEKWKEEERTKLHEEIDGLRQLFLAGFKDVASKSSAVEGKLQELQAREAAVSNLGTLQSDDTEEAWGQTRIWAELRGERERMAAQVSTDFEAPSKDEQAVMDSVYQQMDALSVWLREQPKVLKSQEKAVKLLSTSKPEVTREVTKVVADEESSDRKEAALGGKQRLMEALQRNPNLLKQFRPILEEVLEEKLESMGVRRVAKGISTQTYKSLQALVRLQQQQKAEKFPGLLHLRDELVRAVMGKVRRCKKPRTTLPRQLSIIPAQSLKSLRTLRGSQPMVIPAAEGPEDLVIPQSAPRSRARSTHSPPKTPRGTPWTPKTSRPHQGLIPQKRDSHIHEDEALGETSGCSGTETTRWGETHPSPELCNAQNQPARQETPVCR